MRRAAWEALGGFSDEYFLYHEDTDLGLRLWLGGRRVGLEPRARCEHRYEFERARTSAYFLERNRYATIIRTFPTRLLLALLPGLIATEAALLIVATRGGWLGPKLRAYRDTAGALPRLARERTAVAAAAPTGAAEAPISASQFADRLTPDLDSDYLGAASNSTLLRAMLRGYWRLVRLLIG